VVDNNRDLNPTVWDWTQRNAPERLTCTDSAQAATPGHLESKCMPSPGRQINRMGACHPVDLPEGYHTAARGQSSARPAAVRRGLPASVRAVGLRQVDGMALSRRGAAAGPRCDQMCDQHAVEEPGTTRYG
jgi:hypothetical protein